MTDRRRSDGTAIFAIATISLAGVALVVTLAFALGWIGGPTASSDSELGGVPGTTPNSDGAVGNAAADPATIVAAAGALGTYLVVKAIDREAADLARRRDGWHLPLEGESELEESASSDLVDFDSHD